MRESRAMPAYEKPPAWPVDVYFTPRAGRKDVLRADLLPIWRGNPLKSAILRPEVGSLAGKIGFFAVSAREIAAFFHVQSRQKGRFARRFDALDERKLLPKSAIRCPIGGIWRLINSLFAGKACEFVA